MNSESRLLINFMWEFKKMCRFNNYPVVETFLKFSSPNFTKTETCDHDIQTHRLVGDSLFPWKWSLVIHWNFIYIFGYLIRGNDLSWTDFERYVDHNIILTWVNHSIWTWTEQVKLRRFLEKSITSRTVSLSIASRQPKRNPMNAENIEWSCVCWPTTKCRTFEGIETFCTALINVPMTQTQSLQQIY